MTKKSEKATGRTVKKSTAHQGSPVRGRATVSSLPTPVKKGKTARASGEGAKQVVAKKAPTKKAAKAKPADTVKAKAVAAMKQGATSAGKISSRVKPAQLARAITWRSRRTDPPRAGGSFIPGGVMHTVAEDGDE